MHGFGSHTYSFLNAKNERTWVKFHFRTQQGVENLTDTQAEALIAKDRETHQRDLFESIEAGRFPRWTLFIQVMTDAQAKAFPFNPFDLTKIWPKAEFPLIEVGYFELNRNPENFFAEIEQAAFSPANIVPGIGFSPDKMLQLNEPPLPIDGAAARWDHRVDDDHYRQPGDLFRKMSAAQRQVLFDNTARQLDAVSQPIQERHIANCTEADPAYGAGVAQAIARLGQKGSAEERKSA